MDNKTILETLQAFCAEEPGSQYDCTTPFIQCGRTYGQNNIILVEYDGIAEGATKSFPDHPAADYIAKLFTELDDYDAYTLPVLPALQTHQEHPKIECKNCDGWGDIGFEDDAGNTYSCECQVCGGRGHVFDTSQPERTVVDATQVKLCGHWYFDARYLTLLRDKLPGLKLLVPRKMFEADELKEPPVLCMRWDFGRALLMPLRNGLTVHPTLLTQRLERGSEVRHE